MSVKYNYAGDATPSIPGQFFSQISNGSTSVENKFLQVCRPPCREISLVKETSFSKLSISICDMNSSPRPWGGELWGGSQSRILKLPPQLLTAGLTGLARLGFLLTHLPRGRGHISSYSVSGLSRALQTAYASVACLLLALALLIIYGLTGNRQFVGRTSDSD